MSFQEVFYLAQLLILFINELIQENIFTMKCDRSQVIYMP